MIVFRSPTLVLFYRWTGCKGLLHRQPSHLRSASPLPLTGMGPERHSSMTLFLRFQSLAQLGRLPMQILPIMAGSSAVAWTEASKCVGHVLQRLLSTYYDSIGMGPFYPYHQTRVAPPHVHAPYFVSCTQGPMAAWIRVRTGSCLERGFRRRHGLRARCPTGRPIVCR